MDYIPKILDFVLLITKAGKNYYFPKIFKDSKDFLTQDLKTERSGFQYLTSIKETTVITYRQSITVHKC